MSCAGRSIELPEICLLLEQKVNLFEKGLAPFTSSQPRTTMELPPEIIQTIISQIWDSTLSPVERIAFMTTCPLINHKWKSQYARISTTHIHIPRLTYLFYLSSIARNSTASNFNSLIYSTEEFLQYARIITCFHDVRTHQSCFPPTQDMYHLFTFLDNFIGLRMCFPSVKELRLESTFFPRSEMWVNGSVWGSAQIAYTRVTVWFRGKPGEDWDLVPQTLSSYPLKIEINIDTAEPFVLKESNGSDPDSSSCNFDEYTYTRVQESRTCTIDEIVSETTRVGFCASAADVLCRIPGVILHGWTTWRGPTTEFGSKGQIRDVDKITSALMASRQTQIVLVAPRSVKMRHAFSYRTMFDEKLGGDAAGISCRLWMTGKGWRRYLDFPCQSIYADLHHYGSYLLPSASRKELRTANVWWSVAQGSSEYGCREYFQYTPSMTEIFQSLFTRRNGS